MGRRDCAVRRERREPVHRAARGAWPAGLRPLRPPHPLPCPASSEPWTVDPAVPPSWLAVSHSKDGLRASPFSSFSSFMQRFLPAGGRRPLSRPSALTAPQPPASLPHRRSSSCPHRSEHFLRGGPRDGPVSPEAPAASRKPRARRSATAPSLLPAGRSARRGRPLRLGDLCSSENSRPRASHAEQLRPRKKATAR